MSIIKWLIIFAAFMILFSIIFIYLAGNYLVVDHELTKADAIVVLMGDALGRVPEAADLYKGGYAEAVIMVQGAHETETAEARRDAINLNIPEDNLIVLPGQAKNTWEEAEIVRDYLAQEQGINSLILVNSKFQTRRTAATFERMLGCLDRDITLISRASRYIKVEQDSVYRELDEMLWWQDRGSTKTVIIESVKNIYYYYLRITYKGCDDAN